MLNAVYHRADEVRLDLSQPNNQDDSYRLKRNKKQ